MQMRLLQHLLTHHLQVFWTVVWLLKSQWPLPRNFWRQKRRTKICSIHSNHHSWANKQRMRKNQILQFQTQKNLIRSLGITKLRRPRVAKKISLLNLPKWEVMLLSRRALFQTKWRLIWPNLETQHQSHTRTALRIWSLVMLSKRASRKWWQELLQPNQLIPRRLNRKSEYD